MAKKYCPFSNVCGLDSPPTFDSEDDYIEKRREFIAAFFRKRKISSPDLKNRQRAELQWQLHLLGRKGVELVRQRNKLLKQKERTELSDPRRRVSGPGIQGKKGFQRTSRRRK
ncbi:hypothetical protein KKG83_03780 [Candidatus Micrarchaeota archaeon]|nr:hypothetical protein [Candidatus Micrarchaeota archaeon]MBU2476565.1 hypothetical protein [Candidatus Micrarchaeota archaeon]